MKIGDATVPVSLSGRVVSVLGFSLRPAFGVEAIDEG